MASSARRGPLLAAVSTALLGVAACGGTPAPAAQTAPSPAANPAGVAPEFCDARERIASVLWSAPEVIWEAPARTEAVRARQLDTLRPVFAVVRQAAPRDVADDTDVVVDTVVHGLTTGDLSATMTSAYVTAEATLDAKDVATCGFSTTLQAACATGGAASSSAVGAVPPRFEYEVIGRRSAT